MGAESARRRAATTRRLQGRTGLNGRLRISLKRNKFVQSIVMLSKAAHCHLLCELAFVLFHSC